MVSAEVAPFAKTGGLADVSAALSRALMRAGHKVRLVMPMHERVRTGGWTFKPVAEMQDVPVDIGPRRFHLSFSTATLPKSRVQVWLARCPQLFAREGLYTEDPDEHLRFAFLCHAALRMCQHTGWAPDVVHCNDWHTALIPLYLRTLYGWDRLFEHTRTVLTIHNIGYQGVFGAQVVDELGLAGERHLLHQIDLGHGRVNLLKTGLLYADAISTVSDTYAREIRDTELGMGLQDVLRARGDALVGIVNGVDYGEWDPKHDRHLPRRFSAKALGGKREVKAALLERMGLPHDEDALAAPLIGMVTRLTYQKGLDLLPEVLPALLQQQDARLVVLGSGEARYERALDALQRALPDRVACDRGYKEDLAHWIEGGSDLFLMPSRYEPCGLNQMYSLRYGTPPLVRRTGGLADTVEPWNPRARTGTGFLFDAFEPEALRAALRHALECYRDRDGWRQLMLNGMARDFSWERQVERYVELYRRVAAVPA